MANESIIKLESAFVKAKLVNLLELSAKKDSNSAYITSNILANTKRGDFTIVVDPQKLKASVRSGRLDVDYSLPVGWGTEFSQTIPVGWTSLTIRGRSTGEFLHVTCEVMAGKQKVAEIGGGSELIVNLRALSDEISARVPGYKSVERLNNRSSLNNIDCISDETFCAR